MGGFDTMAFGRVKWFNDSKGFGIIEGPDGKPIFVHYSAIRTDGYKTLLEGQEVEYDLYESKKGLQAMNVTQRN